MQLHVDYALDHPSELLNIAYTRAIRRQKLSHRAFAILQGDQVVQTSDLVKSSVRSLPRKITMVFSGQGSQWVGMGKELLTTSADFRQCILDMDKILQSFGNAPNWRIIGKPEVELQGRPPTR